MKCGKSYVGRSWFFTLIGLKVFHVKNSGVHYFRIIWLLSSQEQPVRSGELTVCKIRQEHNSPSSCVLYSKSQQRLIFMNLCSTENQIAEIFTKALNRKQFERNRLELGLIKIT